MKLKPWVAALCKKSPLGIRSVRVMPTAGKSPPTCLQSTCRPNRCPWQQHPCGRISGEAVLVPGSAQRIGLVLRAQGWRVALKFWLRLISGPRYQTTQKLSLRTRWPSRSLSLYCIWVVVKTMVPFWFLTIIRHLGFSGPKKGTIILTTTHIYSSIPFKEAL